MKICFDQELK